MVAKKIDAGVYKRGTKWVGNNPTLGYQGTYDTEKKAKRAMRDARTNLDEAKLEAIRAKERAQKLARDASGETLHDSREAWLNRRW